MLRKPTLFLTTMAQILSLLSFSLLGLTFPNARCLAAGQVAEQPNVLIILGDDATYSDLPLYGGDNLLTPNIDQLAAEGMTFNRAYVSMAMCQPCRTELYTGLYPHHHGASWNHSAARPETRSIAHWLGDVGYRVGLAGKLHVTPKQCFPFERIGGVEANCVAETCAFRSGGIREFMKRDSAQPFCLIVALTCPHMPWTVGDASQFDPAALHLPRYLVEGKVTRREFCKYLAEIAVLDQQVGRTLDALDAAGHADDTLVLFSSEQGAQWPGCKWTNWEQGVRTGLVARWPGRVPQNIRTNALVQYADILPTLLDASNTPYEPGDFDGTTFLSVLNKQTAGEREYAYAMHNNVPEGPPYPIRSVTDGKYRYIWNLEPNSVYIEKHVFGLPAHTVYWSSWMFAAAEDAAANRLVQRYMRRPAEELYDIAADPDQLNNLADLPKLQAVKTRLRDAVEAWMDAQGDPGVELDRWRTLKARRAAAK